MRPNPHARLVGLPPEPSEIVSTPVIKGEALSEKQLRKSLGLKVEEKQTKLPSSYRSLLNLDPDDLVNFFNAQVGERREFTEVDFVVPRPMLEHRIARLKRVIACSKEIIEGMSARVIKIRRGKDDPLLDDKAAREKYKREENSRIARSNVKLFLYRKTLNTGKDLHQKIWGEVKKPTYFRDLVGDYMLFSVVTDVRWEQTDKLFTGGLQTHMRVQLLEYVRRGEMNLESYRAVMLLGESALIELGETEAEQKEVWNNIRQWENAVIRAAVFHGIITPRRDLAELLGLGSILDEDDEPILADTTEDALAIKTGGACYGGRIRGEGRRFRNGRFAARELSSFDKPLGSINDRSAEYQDSGFGSLRDITDDAESYDPR